MDITRRKCLAGFAGMVASSSIFPAFATDTFKMGLLVSGSVAEEGWNRIAYDALRGVEKALGAKVSYVELQQNPATFEKAFRDYATQGYNVVLGHGFEYGDAALAVAEDFPDMVFLISSSNIHEGKVIGLNTDTSQPFYLMGVLAARLGKRAGLVGGMEIPPIQQAFEGFKNGVKSVNPDFPVSEVYVGSFVDTTAVKEATLSVIASGADFVLPHAGGAGMGGFQAIAESGKGVNTFSVFSDYTEVAPDNILGLCLTDYAAGVVRIVKSVRDGNPPTSNIEFGFADPDVMSFAYNEKAKTPVPAPLREEIAQLQARIASGEIQTRAR